MMQRVVIVLWGEIMFIEALLKDGVDGLLLLKELLVYNR